MIPDHNILLKKLDHYGFQQTVLDLMNSYLSGRSQSVFVNGASSLPFKMQCGVPQGSCLGPLLYLLYVNDMSCALTKSHMITFADDTTLYASGSSCTDIQTALQQDLDNIRDWMDRNKLVLNMKKLK